MNIGDRVTVGQVETVVRGLWNATGVITSHREDSWRGTILFFVTFDKPIDIGKNWVDPNRPHRPRIMNGCWLKQNQIAGFEDY